MQKPRRRRARRAKRRMLWLWIVPILLIAALAAVWLLRGAITQEQPTGPFSANDLAINAWRVGALGDSLNARPLSSTQEAGELRWTLNGALLRLAGDTGRLIGARIDSEMWRGPRGLSVGDPLSALLRAFPVGDYEEQPDDFALLFAEDMQNGLPIAPYGVLAPSGIWLRGRLAAPVSADWLDARQLNPAFTFAFCDFYIDPDNELITRIEWSLAAQDDWLEGLR